MAKEIKNAIIINGIIHELIEDGEKHSCDECSLMNLCTSGIPICNPVICSSDYIYFKICRLFTENIDIVYFKKYETFIENDKK